MLINQLCPYAERDIREEQRQLVFEEVRVYFPIETRRKKVWANLKTTDAKTFEESRRKKIF